MATAAKRNGNKLVGRRGSGQKIMERLEGMMDLRLVELGMEPGKDVVAGTTGG